ncbi:VIT domain-containing protein [Paludisphaera borealis]|uniref:VIT domain-containing protein n=1 Tax=Paludisphaera borealis TaxID=1387353 RepID=UPI00285253BF|nr:VIT domain-containing protein [Paludisphaera borealis]
MAAVVVLSGAGGAWGQGFIIETRRTVPIQSSFEIREVGVDARVRNQAAEVQVSQTFHNPGSTQLEAEFFFPLPEDGAVQDFVLMVDGRELTGRLMNKDEARRIYEEIVRTKRDPALLEYMGRGLYRTSVFPIPPGADRKLTMKYTQLCKRDRDVIEFSYPLSTQKFTSKPIQRLSIRASIESKDSIKSVYCPSDDVRIDRSGDHEVRISMERTNVIPTSDFRMVYTLAEGAIGASVVSYRPSAGDDGYFLLLASPEVKAPDAKPLPKTVIFVLDRSGSMAGKKIEQARRALKSVLNNLRDDDLFNIVVYDNAVETFRPELERFTSRTREEAERYVDNIREGGGTNIDEALTSALGLIRDHSRPNYLLFLTDGLPTAGEVRELSIADHCRKNNTQKARIFSFGVGFDVNARLLDRLSAGNSGTSEYVRPDEDIETHVARFYSKMSSPVLTDLRIEFAGTDVNRTYPRDLPDLFEGGQIVWVGRYRQPGRTTLKVTGRIADESRTFEFPAELADSDRGGGHNFVERIWAVRRIGYLIDQIDLSGQNKELVDELVSLSTKYGIMTPYTSFLADERVQLHAMSQNVDRARLSLGSLSEFSGASGVAQRGAKSLYMREERAAGASFAEPNQITGFSADAAKSGQTGQSAGMMGGMMGGMAGGRSFRRNPAAEAKTTPGMMGMAGQNPEAAIRRVGSKTFYYKDQRWVDAVVKPEEDAKAKLIRQFSDEFFALARSQGAELNQYLTFTEPVTVKLDSAVYRIEPAEDKP